MPCILEALKNNYETSLDKYDSTSLNLDIDPELDGLVEDGDR